MNFRLLLAGGALLLVTLFLLFGVGEWPAAQQPIDIERREGRNAREAGRAAQAVLVSPSEPLSVDSRISPSPAGQVDSDALQQSLQRVLDLEATMGLAEHRLQEAERGLAASEAEVEELEQVIADIKARGEDPADYADLAMDRFQPAFFRFLDAQASYDNAERLRSAAKNALEAARADLARRRSAVEAG